MDVKKQLKVYLTKIKIKQLKLLALKADMNQSEYVNYLIDEKIEERKKKGKGNE